MAAAGDKAWRTILKEIQNVHEDEDLETPSKVKKLLSKIKIRPDLEEELQDTLYDQLTQFAKDELLSDLQIGGPSQSFESYRRAYNHGKKKTAENVHRAQNRVTRPEIAENMMQMETLLT